MRGRACLHTDHINNLDTRWNIKQINPQGTGFLQRRQVTLRRRYALLMLVSDHKIPLPIFATLPHPLSTQQRLRLADEWTRDGTGRLFPQGGTHAASGALAPDTHSCALGGGSLLSLARTGQRQHLRQAWCTCGQRRQHMRVPRP